jgi:hypothetical protein
MNKRLILAAGLSAIGIALISSLPVLGNNVSVPTPLPVGEGPSSASLTYPEGASDRNYTVLCIKNGDAKIRFTRTGPYVTCPPDYATVPVKLDPNLLKK